MSITQESESSDTARHDSRVSAFDTLREAASDHPRHAVLSALRMLAIEYGSSAFVPRSGGEQS